jgi:hypothetical protein
MNNLLLIILTFFAAVSFSPQKVSANNPFSPAIVVDGEIITHYQITQRALENGTVQTDLPHRILHKGFLHLAKKNLFVRHIQIAQPAHLLCAGLSYFWPVRAKPMIWRLPLKKQIESGYNSCLAQLQIDQ